LTDPEIDRLFARIGELRAGGAGILYISHRMDEIRRIADRITVLRDGRLIATRSTAAFALDDIVRLMVGRELGDDLARCRRTPGGRALEVQNLRRYPAVRDVSFAVREGEILGFAGLMGSGRTEAMRALFGVDRADGGEILLGDPARPVTIRSSRDAVRLGLAFLTENRKEEGLLLPLPLRANITLGSLDRLSGLGGWIHREKEATASARWIAALGVRCRHQEQRAAELSGGNQQKLLMARWLLRDARILILDEPTRGIDVGAKFEVYRLLDQLAAQGKAILMISSDLLELMTVADRIAVLSAGRLVRTFSRHDWSQEEILAAAFSGYQRQSAGPPHARVAGLDPSPRPAGISPGPDGV
jgi:ribose transport system ATP-binding protein